MVLLSKAMVLSDKGKGSPLRESGKIIGDERK